MKKKFLILLLISVLCANMSAKDICLYSYQAEKVDFINQPLITIIDSIIGHVENMSCHCNRESIAYNFFFIKTSDWPSDKRMVIEVYVDEMQNYLCKEWRYVSYFDRKGKISRINVNICCEEDIDWVNAVTYEFFKITDTIKQNKYKRTYTDEEFRKIYERGCRMAEDGGSEIYFVYDDGVIYYWQGNFCDGSVLLP